MPLDILVTTDRINKDPLGRDFINYLQSNSNAYGLDESVLYYDFPTYSDYETVTHKPDALLLSQRHGVIAIRLLDAQLAERNIGNIVNETDESLGQFCSILIGRLLKSRVLRLHRAMLTIRVTPVILCLTKNAKRIFNESESEIAGSFKAFEEILLGLDTAHPMSAEQFSEARSVVEGAKALNRPTKRMVGDASAHKAANALVRLESEIANFDNKQRRAALVTINGPQRIRGLAGSGKTVILAMKAAHLHLTKPEDHILITFWTKSLRSQLKNLITKFYRHYKEVDPNWDNIHIRHGWGGSSVGGVYSDACRRANVPSKSYGTARNNAPAGMDPFEYVCRDLLSQVEVEPFYDHVLIDEGQDFPDGFYALIFYITVGQRDKKNIVWAYDELQNILNVRTRSPEELFGIDDDGKVRISLSRAETGLPPGATNDTVLSKCYRNQREILVMAHALGFGIYSQIVQLLESPDHWQDVGYEVITSDFVVGQPVEILRPEENSPVSLTGEGLPKLIKYEIAPGLHEEVAWIVAEAIQFIQSGLQPEDIMVVALDDRNMRAYFKHLSAKFASHNIATNNIHADPYSEPAFTITGRVTLSTVYRAKGNEAAVVFAIGTDALSLDLRSHRNRLFAAFTRTKAWLRVSGVSLAAPIGREIDRAAENFPFLRFKMPDLANINLIQRDLSERAVEGKQIRKEYFARLKRAGFSDDEIAELLAVEDKNVAG